MRWTIEACLVEAKKYNKRSDFRKDSHKAYMAARSHGWLDQVCSHMQTREQVIASKLIFEKTLAARFPQIAEEWHPSKNGNINPKDVSAHKNKVKYWWICKNCEFEWQATINNRTSNDRGCPNCSRGTQTSYPEQVIFYYIKQLFPDAINRYKLNSKTEIDVFIPSKSIGIEYDGEAFHSEPSRQINDICKDKTIHEHGIYLIRYRELGCPDIEFPYSETIKVKYSPSCSDLASKLQLLLNRLSEVEESNVIVDLAKDRNTIKAIIANLPYEQSYAYYEESRKRQGLLKAIWDCDNNEIKPDKVSPAANLDINWICPKDSNHRWKSKLYSITSGNGGCPWCSGRHHFTTEEWIEKARNVHGYKFDYSKVNYLRGDSTVTIICPIHGEFEQTPDNHLRSKNGCPFCSNQGGDHINETLLVKYPDLVDEWDYDRNLKELGTEPKSVNVHGSVKYYWKCTNGLNHSYRATIYEKRKGMGCAVCHGKQVSFDTSLASIYPELLSIWSSKNDVSPEEITVGGDKKYLWECEKHGTYKAIIRNMAAGRCCCPQCNNHKLSPADYKNRIESKYPNIELLSDYKRMTEKVTYHCTICGIIKEIRPQDLDKRGCTKCNK